MVFLITEGITAYKYDEGCYLVKVDYIIMEVLYNLINERPALLVRYIAFAIIALASVVTFFVRKHNMNKPKGEKMQSYSAAITDDVNVVLPEKSVTLFFKKANDEFFDKMKELLKEFQVENYKNGFSLITSFDLHCLVESENLTELDLLANECEELVCFGSHSTVGFYGFFHYKNGKCLRGYSSLDESGEVLHNIGNISNAEKELGFRFPRNSNEFAEADFDEINHETLEKMLLLIIN